MSEHRTAAFIILSGTNGTGKSTLLLKFITHNERNLIIPANLFDDAWNKFKKIKPKHKFVLDPRDPNKKRKVMKWYIPNLNSFKGSAVLDVRGMEEMGEDPRIIFEYICLKYRKGGLFIDDFKNYIRASGILPNYVTRIFRDRRHKMVDIFMASHSMSDINGEFLQFEPIFVVFKITRPLTKAVKDRISNYAELDRIIEKAKKEYNKGNIFFHEPFKPNEIT